MKIQNVLSVVTFLPLLGVLVLMLSRRVADETVRWMAFLFSLLPLALVGKIVLFFNPSIPGMQFVESREWIKSLEINYHVGVDGLSVAMILLVSIVTPLAVLASFRWVSSLPYRGSLKTFYILILIEQAGLYGAFTALDFFHWFIFWEASLVPIFFLIKMYGNENRRAAAFQFFIYTFVGSVAMMIGMQFIYLATGTWDFVKLAEMAQSVGGKESELVVCLHKTAGELGGAFLQKHVVTLVFLMIFAGFAVKVPMWPFHTWLPLTYTQASSPVSMILTGLMSKMGVYGFLRLVLPLFGGVMSEYYTLLMIFAVITILWGAWAAFAQQDFKTLIAYSSISHLGYCLFGIFALASPVVVANAANFKAIALNGVIVQMFAHGLSAAGLFYFVGVIEQRLQTREIGCLGGLRKNVPIFCGFFGITVFASLGLPGLAGFVGEYMIFQGAFPLASGLTAAAVVGIVLTALYLLKLLTQSFFGPENEKLKGISDLTPRELLVALAFVVLLFGVGLYPKPIINLSNGSVIQAVDVLPH